MLTHYFTTGVNLNYSTEFLLKYNNFKYIKQLKIVTYVVT